MVATGIGEGDGVGPDAMEICGRRDFPRSAFGSRGQREEAIQVINKLPRLEDGLYASKSRVDLTRQQPDRDQGGTSLRDSEAASGNQPRQQEEGQRQQGS